MTIGELEKKLADLAKARADVDHAQAIKDRHRWYMSWAWLDRQNSYIDYLERKLWTLREEEIKL